MLNKLFGFGTPGDPNLIGPLLIIGIAVIVLGLDIYFLHKRSKEPGFDPWSEL
jgi:hypothetical protein